MGPYYFISIIYFPSLPHIRQWACSLGCTAALVQRIEDIGMKTLGVNFTKMFSVGTLILFIAGLGVLACLESFQLAHLVPFSSSIYNGPLTFSVVFFSVINPNHADANGLLRSQLSDLVASGAADAAQSVDVILSPLADWDRAPTNTAQARALYKSAADDIRSIIPRASIVHYPMNHFEQPGLLRALLLARAKPAAEAERHFVLYFHGKGMTSAIAESRSHANIVLTRTVVADWRRILIRLEKGDVDTAGYTTSTVGWQWYNFWWARASYLQGIVEPLIVPRRHYYEDWLARTASPEHSIPSQRALAHNISIITNVESGVFPNSLNLRALTLCRQCNPNWEAGIHFDPPAIFSSCPI